MTDTHSESHDDLLDLVRRMDDLFVRCDPAQRQAADLPEYTPSEWNALHRAVREALPDLSRTPIRRRLLILACSNTKRRDADRIPARERYNGPLWQTLRAVDPRGELAHVAFLSAQYGFRAASTPIEHYDARMTPEIARAMIEGSIYTRWPRPRSWKRLESGDHAEQHMRVMTHERSYPITDIALVGGELYLTVMRSFVSDFQEKRYVTQHPDIVEINDTIGRMRKGLREWLLLGIHTTTQGPNAS